MIRKLLFGTLLLLANAAVIGLWWLWTEPETYLWSRTAPDVTEAVRRAAREVFWWRWPVWALLVNAGIGVLVLLRNSQTRRAGAVVAAALLIAFGVDRLGDRALADEYFTLFQLQERAEPLLTSPLLEAGPEIGPYLLAYVQDPEAELRRYAINGIGKVGHAPAVPYLIRLMNDTAETYYFRADAWESLREIDTPEARRAVTEFENSLTWPGADSALVGYVVRVRSRGAS